MKFEHSAFRVNDLGAAVKFLKNTTAFEVKSEIRSGDVKATFLNDGMSDAKVELIQWSSENEIKSHPAHLGISVSSVDQTLRNVLEYDRTTAFVGPIMRKSGLKLVFVKVPTSELLVEFIERPV